MRWPLNSALLAMAIGLGCAAPAFGSASDLTLAAPTDASTTTDTTPTFSGTASNDSGDQGTVTVNVTGVSPDTTNASFPAIVQSDGTWSADAPSTLPEGTYTANATQTLADASTPTSTSHTFHIGPVASFTFGPGAPSTGQSVQFTSTSSTPTGSAATEHWDLGNDGTYDFSGPSFSHAFAAPGSYVVRLRVTDDHGGPPSDSTQVIIVADRPPAAGFIFSPGAPLTGDTITFASTSSDSDDPIVSQAWDLNGDGNFGDAGGASATTSFATSGPHTVSLRVTDASGASAVSSQTVTVGLRPVPAPQLLSPFPIVRIAGRASSAGATLRLLTVQAPAGATVEIRCRGKGCPWKRRRRVAPGRVGDGLLKLVSFGGFRRPLRPGAVMEIRVWKTGRIGKYTRFVIRRNRAPKRTDSCMMPGRASPKTCPAS